MNNLFKPIGNETVLKLHEGLYKEEYKKYKKVLKQIPNNYFLSYIALALNKQHDILPNKVLITHYKSFLWDKLTNTLSWDLRPVYKSHGTIKFSKTDFSYKDLFEDSNSFLIQCEMEDKTYFIKDFIQKVNFNTNEISFIRSYDGTDKQCLKFPYILKMFSSQRFVSPIAEDTLHRNTPKGITRQNALFERLVPTSPTDKVPEHYFFQFLYEKSNEKTPKRLTGLGFMEYTNRLEFRIFESRDPKKNFYYQFYYHIMTIVKEHKKKRYIFYTADPEFHETSLKLIKSIVEFGDETHYTISNVNQNEKNETTSFQININYEPLTGTFEKPLHNGYYENVDNRFQLPYMYPNFNPITVTICNLTSIFGSSLEVMANLKMTNTFEQVNSMTIKQYLLNWSHFLLTYREKLIKEFQSELIGIKTLTHLSLRIFRTSFLRNMTIQNDSYYMHNLLKNVNRSPLIYKKDGTSIGRYSYDFNNYYAYLNTNYIFPGFLRYMNSSKWTYSEMGYLECEIEQTNESKSHAIPFLNMTNEKETKMLFSEEKKYAEELGYKMEIKKVYEFIPLDTKVHAGYIDGIKEYTVDILGKIKESKTKEEQYFLKQLLRRLYGQLGSSKKSLSNEVTNEETINGTPFYQSLYLDHDTDPRLTSLTQPMYSSLARYGAIVAYGRLHIHRFCKENGIEVITLNTDGFTTNEPIDSKWLGTEPGQLKQVFK